MGILERRLPGWISGEEGRENKRGLVVNASLVPPRAAWWSCVPHADALCRASAETFPYRHLKAE